MKRVMGLVVILFGGGCLPIPIPYGPYYQPFYEDATTQVIREECHGYSGPSSGIRFQLPQGITVAIKTAYSSGYSGGFKHPFLLTMTIPKGVEVAFVSDHITVIGKHSLAIMPKTLSVGATGHIDGNATITLLSLLPISRATLQQTHQEPSMGVWFWLRDQHDTGFEPNTLELHFPNLLVEGEKEVRFDPIVLHAKTVHGDKNYVTPSIEALRQQKYERCLHETPKRRCATLLEIYPEGFTLVKEDFNITGRVGGWKGLIGVGVNDMVVTSLRPWRFNPTTITLKDLERGTLQTRNLQTLYLHTGNYEVPFTSVVHAPLGEIKGFASIYLNGSLGEERDSEVSVLLPSLLINGKKFNFKPIKLQLKLLDGEFPPFNC
ncbi:MAG: hypothetical protein WA080_02405 [Sulfuricurvum sp.]